MGTISKLSTGYDSQTAAENARTNWLKTWGPPYFPKAGQPFRDSATGKWHFHYERADSCE